MIGGGYATGREVAEFFLPSGPWGGLAAIALATVLFSAGCALTFLFALATRSLDYQSFFKALLGRGWVAWEVTYILFVILILAVYGAAAGEIGVALFGLPTVAGTLVLMAGIILAVMYGNKSVERLFEWVSYLLYGVYALFFVLAFSSFGDRIVDAFAAPSAGRRVGAERRHLFQLQRHRRDRRAAGGAALHRPARRDHRGRDLRPADDAAGAAVLHRGGRLPSRDHGRDAAVRLPAAAARHAVVPLPVPADGLFRAAGKRRERGPRVQRARRQDLAAPPRRAARAARGASSSRWCCWCCACSWRAPSAWST